MALNVGVNSYISRADADAFFADDIRFATWALIVGEMKDRLLVTASRNINLLVVADCKLPLTTISTELQQATAELAIEYSITPAMATQANTGSNLKRARAGSAEAEFFRPTNGSRFPSNVMNFLRAGDCLGGAAFTAPESFGTDEQSGFDAPDEFDRNRGLG